VNSRIGALVLFATVAGLTGCETREECVPRPVPVTNSSGDVYRCTAAEDCPRSSHVSLCVADTGTQQECVRCLDTECVLISPLPESC
jgi:hypothetical protein